MKRSGEDGTGLDENTVSHCHDPYCRGWVDTEKPKVNRILCRGAPLGALRSPGCHAWREARRDETRRRRGLVRLKVKRSEGEEARCEARQDEVREREARDASRETRWRGVGKRDEIHTSAIERPDPYGNLYFIRSHGSCTPVTCAPRIIRSRRTVRRSNVHVNASTLARIHTYRYIILNPYRELVIFQNDTTVYTEPPLTHFAILLKIRRAPDNDSCPYRGYRVRMFPGVAVRNARGSISRRRHDAAVHKWQREPATLLAVAKLSSCDQSRRMLKAPAHGTSGRVNAATNRFFAFWN